MMGVIPVLAVELGLILAFFLARYIWRRFRLRRALFMFRQQIAWSLKHAQRDKLVLDVGSGNNPFLRADVLCEKYIHDDVHRGGGVASERPLVAGDASALPFKSSAFDALVSSHMIEHLPDPVAFFREAGRVADSGLFVAPPSLGEQLQGTPAHLWMIEQKGDVLSFTGKTQPICNPLISRFFAAEVTDTLKKADEFLLDHWESLEINYTWLGEPQCVVEGEPGFSGAVEASTVATEATATHTPRGAERLRGFLRRWVRGAAHSILSSNGTIDWSAILACPQCRGDVTVSTSDVYCSVCELSFPIEEDVPIMLVEHAVSCSHSERGEGGAG